MLRPILNLACNSITNGVYMLANCSECCVMLYRGHYLAIYENPILRVQVMVQLVQQQTENTSTLHNNNKYIYTY